MEGGSGSGCACCGCGCLLIFVAIIVAIVMIIAFFVPATGDFQAINPDGFQKFYQESNYVSGILSGKHLVLAGYELSDLAYCKTLGKLL